jgi:hypothetical protein
MGPESATLMRSDPPPSLIRRDRAGEAALVIGITGHIVYKKRNSCVVYDLLSSRSGGLRSPLSAGDSLDFLGSYNISAANPSTWVDGRSA